MGVCLPRSPGLGLPSFAQLWLLTSAGTCSQPQGLTYGSEKRIPPADSHGLTGISLVGRAPGITDLGDRLPSSLALLLLIFKLTLFVHFKLLHFRSYWVGNV